MAFTTPIFVPLAQGLDLGKSATLGEKDLVLAQNIDFSVQGEVRGRPGRAAADLFTYRQSSAGMANYVYSSAGSLASTGFTPRGLMAVRDGALERPALGTEGRLFLREDGAWRDRGHFACMRADRVHDFYQHGESAVARKIVAPDFGASGGSTQVTLLDGDTHGFERLQLLAQTPANVGGSARCGTTTAAVFRTSANNLYLVTRSNGALSLTETLIAADAAAWTDAGDAASICCDHDQTVFFVAYKTTTANQVKVLRVTTGGSVTATYSNTFGSARNGLWVSNAPLAADRLLLATTHGTGADFTVLVASTMAAAGIAGSDTTTVAGAAEVVVGVESASRYWYAFRSVTNQRLAIGSGDLVLGTATRLLTYHGGTAAGSRWHTPVHQPVLDGSRMYLTVANALYPDASSGAVGTWFTLDLHSLSPVGPFSKPTIAARGRLDGLALALGTSASTRFQPESATLLTDRGWVFATTNWSEYQVTESFGDTFSVGTSVVGLKPVTVLNSVRPSGPRAVAVGGATLFSGSVPRHLAGDVCYELGFPAGRPHMATDVDGGAGSSLVGGDYTVYALWAYVDGAGQVHRSNATGRTQTIGAGDDITVFVETPWFSERPDAELFLEVYCSVANAPADDPCYLVLTEPVDFTAGVAAVSIHEEPTTSTKPLYLLQGEFAHFTPNADGGIAALGRRVWAASSDTVYASLLLNPRQGPAWNDEGSLSVSVPAGAGRILALEGLNDLMVVFCERGVYAVQDGGPNNVGVGDDLSFPVKLTDLGCAGPRSTCNSDRGVVFCAPLDADDPQRGGPWLLDRTLSLTDRKFLGAQAMEYFRGDGSWVPEVAFSPERQQVYVSVPVADEAVSMATYGAAGESPPAYISLPTTNTGVVVIDTRNSKWSTWTAYDAVDGELRFITVVGGCLWELRDEVRGYTEAPGNGDETETEMVIRTTNLFADGRDGFGWSRVRAVSVLGPVDLSGTYDLLTVAWLDQTRVHDSGLVAIAEPVPVLDTGTWPGTRTAPEWRLPTQKCSSIQVELRCSTHNPRWTAIRLDVQPIATGRAPASPRT